MASLEMKDAVGRVWTFLDQLADNDPAEYKKFIKKAMEERKEYLEPPRPAFCFSTGIRGKEDRTLYVNVCKWNRVPLPSEDNNSSEVPVKGGILRHVVEDGKRRQNDLVIDIAFNPVFIQSNIRDSEVMDMLIMLILDFIDEYLSLTTDRKTKIISQSFKGPEKDISFSLDHSTPEQISRESWLDLSDTVLASIRRDWNMKASRKETTGVNLPPLFPQQQRRGKQDGGRRQSDGASKLIEEVQQSSGGRQSMKSNKKRRSRNSGSNHSRTANKQGSGDSRGAAVEDDLRGRGRKVVVPQHTMELRRERGREVVFVRAKLPEVASVVDVSLDSTSVDMCLLAAGTYFLSLPLPLPVNPETSTATFSKRSRTLYVILPVASN